MPTLSLPIEAQQPNVAKLQADAQKFFDGMTPDQAKREAHQQTINGPVDRADREIEGKKRLDLSRLRKKLGPEHVALIEAVKDLHPESPHGRELALIIASLDENP